MIECMLAAPSSGSGKTALACALLAALQKRGLAPCAFKCGPDYIDPMFHRSVLGVESHNLDLFLCGEDAARTLYARHAAGHGAAVVEGVMGFYDGVGGVTARASAWHVARTLDLPVLLVLRPRGASLTLAAQVRGLLAFRQPSHIAGILLNDCSAMLARSLAPMLEQETGVPVLGYLPHMPEAAFESRHLGLYTAAEIDGLAARIGALAAQLEQSVDMPRLLALCGRRTADGAGRERKAPARKQAARIAVARDEAFCFAYAETLESLREAGALPGAGVRRQKLVRFGYAQLTARADSLLLRAGETVPVHEFHYWDSTENGAAFNAQKPATGRSWTCGFAGPALYAAFPHLYFAGRPQLAERFVRAAAAFQSGR